MVAGQPGGRLGFGLQPRRWRWVRSLLVQALLVTSLLFALPLSAWWVGRRITRLAVAVGGAAGRLRRGDRLRRQPVEGACARRHGVVALGDRHAGPGAAAVPAGRQDLGGQAGGRRAAGAGGRLAVGPVRGADQGVSWTRWTTAYWRAQDPESCIPWALVGLAATAVQQSSFRAGSMAASLPAVTVSEPMVGSILGIAILGETLRPGSPGGSSWAWPSSRWCSPPSRWPASRPTTTGRHHRCPRVAGASVGGRAGRHRLIPSPPVLVRTSPAPRPVRWPLPRRRAHRRRRAAGPLGGDRPARAATSSARTPRHVRRLRRATFPVTLSPQAPTHRQRCCRCALLIAGWLRGQASPRPAPRSAVFATDLDAAAALSRGRAAGRDRRDRRTDRVLVVADGAKHHHPSRARRLRPPTPPGAEIPRRRAGRGGDADALTRLPDSIVGGSPPGAGRAGRPRTRGGGGGRPRRALRGGLLRGHLDAMTPAPRPIAIIGPTGTSGPSSRSPSPTG